MFKLLSIVGIILIFWNVVIHAPGVLVAVVILSILFTYFWFQSKEVEIQHNKDMRLARERKSEEERIRAEEERIRKEKLVTYGHDITIKERGD